MLGILNEKPSQARNFAKALGGMSGTFNGEQYVIVPARGHLFGFIQDPSKQVGEALEEQYKSWELEYLPWNENDFKWAYARKNDSAGILSEIKKKLSACDEIVIATDDDPTGEGELLAWEIIYLLKINAKKYTRMFFADESEKEIQKAFKNRKLLGNNINCMYDDPDYKQALFRTKWDYLSMQWTRIATKYSPYGQVPRQGRLKSAMDRLVGDQLDAIAKYVKKPYYQARFKDENNITYINEKADNYDKAEDVPIGDYHTSSVVCDSKTMKNTAPQKYLDLATLGGLLSTQGISAKTVESTYQKMYEANVVSYPRTEDKCITVEQFNELLPFIDDIADLVGVDKKLLTHRTPRLTHVKSGMAHGANRPGPSVPKDLASLDSTYGPGARKIYETLAKNYLATLCEDYRYEQQKGHVKDYPDFVGVSNVPKEMGWKLVFSETEDKDENESAKGLGTTAEPFTYEGANKKPQTPTMKWLMKQLEKYDVGTGATRLSIYADVTNVKSKFPLMKETHGRLTLLPNGETSWLLLKDTHIGNLELTEKVMKQMKDIYNGKTDGNEYLHDIQRMIREDMITMKENSQKYNTVQEKKTVGICPVCGKDIIESDKGFYCSGWSKGCKTGIFKSAYGLEFNKDDFIQVASGEEITKNGRTFYYNFETNKLCERGTKSTVMCPCCSEYMEETDDSWFCKCGFKTDKIIREHRLTVDEINKLAEDCYTDVIEDFISKSGKKFPAKLKLKDKRLEFEFEQAPATETGIKCPCCRKKSGMIMEQEKRYVCECGFSVNKNIKGHIITRREMEDLCNNGITEKLDGFQKNSGGTYSCRLKVDKRNKGIKFDFS